MKYPFSLLVLMIALNTSIAQSNDNTKISFDCFACSYGDYDYNVGFRIGMGYGVLKPMNALLDLTANLSLNYWRYEVQTKGLLGNIEDSFIEDNVYFNLAIGERIKVWEFNKSKIFTGVNLNVQAYFNLTHRRMGLGIEPNIGWSRAMGQKSEFFLFLAYDQHLSSYNRRYSRHPGKLSLVMGINRRLEERRNE